MTTLCQLLEDWAAKFGPKTALLIKRGYHTERWSFQYLKEFSQRLAIYLRAKGLQPGDRVLLLAPNSPEWVGIYFGCLRAGIILVPLDISSTPDFVTKIRDKTRAGYLFTSHSIQNQLPDLNIPVILLEELPHDLETIGPDLTLPLPDEEDIAEVMFTSGTTGEPKGVVLAHRNIAGNVLAATQVIPVKPNSRVLSILPLSHMLEQTAGLLGFLSFGATVIFPVGRQPNLILRTLHEQHITNMIVVPQVLQLFWNAIEREVKKQGKEHAWQRLLQLSAHLPVTLRRLIFRSVHRQLGGCLEFIICGGAYLDPELANRWELIGIAVIQGYGTTEAAPIVTVNPLKQRRLDSVGKVLPGQEIQITPDGEVLIRGPNVSPGYWQDTEATDVAFDGNWYRTGDLGFVDDQGYLYLRGRMKDMIALSSGMNVYAQDVEKALKTCPGVSDACVLGMPTTQGETNVYAVLLMQEPDINPKEIIEQANKLLAEHQRIQGVTVWPFPEFPLTHTLKVKKQEIMDYVLKGSLVEEVATEVPATERAGAVPVLFNLVASLTGMPVASIYPAMTLGEDLNLDSLGRVELLAAIETELDTYIDESDISADTTLAELQALVASESKVLKKEQGQMEWPLNRLVGFGRLVIQSIALFPLLRLFAPIEEKGVENLKEITGPVLIATNHQSHLDTPVVLSVLPLARRRRMAVAAAADFWFAGSLVKKLLSTTLFNAFPFSRTGSIRPTLEHCCRLMDRGWSVLIYPEGTRSETGYMGPFKSGAGLMAVELGVPVVPIYIRGTYQILPKSKVMPWRGRVQVHIGKAIRFPVKTSYIEATEALEEAVKTLEEQSV